jgi:hypothetical protein
MYSRIMGKRQAGRKGCTAELKAEDMQVVKDVHCTVRCTV